MIKHFLELYEFAKRIRIRNVPKHLKRSIYYPDTPSMFNIIQVSGSISIEDWLIQGIKTIKNMEEVLNRNNLSIYNFSSILDFGCGCGRVLRHLQHLGKRVYIAGCDYNRNLITYCKGNLENIQFFINRSTPPLPFKSNTYQFVYAISVLTHLPNKQQVLWLNEISRILKPLGYFLFSIAPKKGHQHILYPSFAGSNFCCIYQSKDEIDRLLPDSLKLIDYSEKASLDSQDIYLVQKSER